MYIVEYAFLRNELFFQMSRHSSTLFKVLYLLYNKCSNVELCHLSYAGHTNLYVTILTRLFILRPVLNTLDLQRIRTVSKDELIQTSS